VLAARKNLDRGAQAGCGAGRFEISKPLTSILSPFGGERKLPPAGYYFSASDEEKVAAGRMR